MEPRGRRLGADVVGGPIPLDLIDAIERDVEPIATLVLDDGDLDGALAHEHLLHTAVNPDAVLEMHHVISGLERGETLERTASGVASGATKSTFAAKDFVVGEDSIAGELRARRSDEASVENSNCQACGRDPIVVQQLVESLRLAGIITEYKRRDPVGDNLLEPLDVALDLFRLAERKHEGCIVSGQIDRSVGSQRPHGIVGGLEQLIATGGVLAAPPREVDMVLCFGPRPLELGLHVGAARNDEKSIGRKQRSDRRSRRLDVARRDLSVNGENQGKLGISRRSLGEKVKVPQLSDVVAPELEPHRLGHAEAVDVEYSAAHTELRDVLHHQNALESDGFQMRGQLLGATGVTLSQLQASRG